jgi:hypothetical protein
VCFSASASYVAGITIGGLGVATLRLVPDRRERMFAALPLVFGVHQILEGVIWSQLEDAGQAAIRTPAVEIWLLIAWLVLPIYAPLAVRRFEPDGRRRQWMLACAVVGAGIGLFMAVESMVAGATASAVHHHIQYAIPVHPGWPLAIPYGIATCVPMLLSSRRFVVVFGIVVSASMIGTAIADAMAFSSVWCFFAALLSSMLFAHYARLRVPDLRLPSTTG